MDAMTTETAAAAYRQQHERLITVSLQKKESLSLSGNGSFLLNSSSSIFLEIDG